MENRPQGIGMGVTALAIYVVGGLGAFSGIALIVLMKGKNLLGMGDGRSIGYLFLCVGVCFSLIGVIMMRIFRNRPHR